MYEEYLEAAVAMAREAGTIQLRGFRSGDLGVETKSNLYDVVTHIDKECEALIARRIAERFPDHSLLGEEGGERGAAGSEWRWVVDPLDGTTNYSQGLPVFAVSIALQHCGQTVVGVVYAPWLDELYTAVKGGGARLVQRGAEPRTLRVAAHGVGSLRPVLRCGRVDRRILGAGPPQVGCLRRRVDRRRGRRTGRTPPHGSRRIDHRRQPGTDRGHAAIHPIESSERVPRGAKRSKMQGAGAIPAPTFVCY